MFVSHPANCSRSFIHYLFVLAHIQAAVMAQLAPLVVPALKKHTATVIWAHGLGDTSVQYNSANDHGS